MHLQQVIGAIYGKVSSSDNFLSKKTKVFLDSNCQDQKDHVMLNVERYRPMLKEFFFPKIEENTRNEIGLQQDRATCHTAKITLNNFRTVLENRIISQIDDETGLLEAVICLHWTNFYVAVL